MCHLLFSHAVYGWKDKFLIGVRKGSRLILTVGYLKGTPLDRVLFGVDYDTNSELERNSLLDVCCIVTATDLILQRPVWIGSGLPSHWKLKMSDFK